MHLFAIAIIRNEKLNWPLFYQSLEILGLFGPTNALKFIPIQQSQKF